MFNTAHANTNINIYIYTFTYFISSIKINYTKGGHLQVKKVILT